MKPNLRGQSGRDADLLDDPPILYLRNAILVRDPERARAETSPAVREWSLTFRLIVLAAIAGSILGILLQ